MRRALTIAGLAAFCLLEPLVAQSRAGGVVSSKPLPMSRNRLVESGRKMNPIRALLLKKVEQVSWDEATFEEVLEWLRAQSTSHGRVNVVVRWRALEAESIDRESVVSLEMKGTTVASIFNEVLDQLSDLEPLTYIGVGNMLKISTQIDFDRKLYSRTYDIQDIFVEIKNFRGAPKIDLQQQQQSGGGGGGSGGQARVQSIFGQGGGGGGGNDDDDEEEDDEREDELLEKLRLVVAPDSWEDAGGFGRMTIINRQLIVLNTLEVHEKLGGSFRHDE